MRPAPLPTELRNEADKMDRLAIDAEKLQQQRLRNISYRRALDLSSKLAVELADTGLSLDEAAKEAAKRYDNMAPEITSSQINFRAGEALKRRENRDKKRAALNLERQILTYWRDDLTDVQIGKHLKRHPRNIAKKRRQALATMRTLYLLDDAVKRLIVSDLKREANLWVNCLK